MSMVKLTRALDPDALAADCRAIQDSAMSTPAGYPGEGHIGWTSICLYSNGSGAASILDRAPYIARALADLGLHLRLVRLLALAPGGAFLEHRDAFLSKRIVRLHVPIVTHSLVEMYVDGVRCNWLPGEFWYADFSRPHSGINRSALTRIHLVLDVSVDENMVALLPPGPTRDTLTRLTAGAGGDEIEPHMLERFAFDFILPAGFELPGTGLEKLPEATPGCLRLIDSELVVFVNQQPLLKAVAVSEEILDLLGLGSQARLEFAFDGERVRNVVLTMGATPVFSFDVARAQTASSHETSTSSPSWSTA